ncbi:VOC family protein [Nakamurella leprariae]|uniref:VOC family protein n=1 Tax=Nakamurella leprariae TaxID=2803911 RepID=A0A938YC66_9ACTN|nr:VOC family protein [Nakamurella leprariae]MBM9466911.1 VOC family protein [Nakamurella leprariae]
MTSQTDPQTPAVAPVPAGFTSLTPFLVVTDGPAAIDFYCDAFGASVVSRMDGPDGRVQHAELQFEQGRLQLADAMPDFKLVAPEVTPGQDPSVNHSTVLYCGDVDAVVARAQQLGGTVREPVSTFVTGDRFASILDPFGHRWAVMTRVEDVSPEEAERRLAAWAEQAL